MNWGDKEQGDMQPRDWFILGIRLLGAVMLSLTVRMGFGLLGVMWNVPVEPPAWFFSRFLLNIGCSALIAGGCLFGAERLADLCRIRPVSPFPPRDLPDGAPHPQP
jgi:hypothetical protein